MVQRGHSPGGLDVVAQPDAVDLVLGCVVEDPRWDTEHSHARASLFEALHAIDPVTAEPFAAEALHDCESAVRALGATTCVSTPGNLQRVTLLRDDPIEDDDVRLAAAKRVSTDNS